MAITKLLSLRPCRSRDFERSFRQHGFFCFVALIVSVDCFQFYIFLLNMNQFFANKFITVSGQLPPEEDCSPFRFGISVKVRDSFRVGEQPEKLTPG